MITLGADPELFLRDDRTGAATSVVGLIGGTKGTPLPMDGMGDGYGIQEDNVMAEFNIPVCTSPRRFSRSVEAGVSWIRQLVRTSLPHHSLDVGACARLFPHSELENKQAMVFGCSPDFNAHKQGEAWPVIKPESLSEDYGAWRFAGGHVHIGYESAAPDFVAAAFADVFLGLPSVSLDKQGSRRALYGQAGRYRPTTYGVEYRSLSNFWIWDRRVADDIGSRAYSLGNLLEGDPEVLQKLYTEVPWIDVREAINEEDEGKAADLIAYLSTDLKIGGL